MAKKLSVDLELNAQGYTQGINEAKGATAQYTNATRDLKKETDEYLEQFGNLRKDFSKARNEAKSLAAAFYQLSDTEKKSELGKYMQEQLDIAIRKAAEFKDISNDVDEAIRRAASDTQGWDALKDGLEIGKDLATTYAGAVAKLTGNEKALKDMVATVAMVQGGANAMIKIGNALQKQSNIMIALGNVQLKAKAIAEELATKKTIAATAAQRVFNAVAKANPYVLLATTAIAAAAAIGGYMLATKNASKEDENHKRQLEELKKANDEYKDTFKNTATNLITKYRELQTGWSNLKTELEKTQFIKKHANEFKNLGTEVKNVNDANNFLVRDTKKVEAALMARAKAAAYAAKAQFLYGKAIEKSLELEELREKKTTELNSVKGEKTIYKTVGTSTSGAVQQVKVVQSVAEQKKAINDKYRAEEQQFLNDIKTYNDQADSLIKKGASIEIPSIDAGSGGSGGSKVVDKMLPKMPNVNAQINKWFKDFDKKIAAEASKMKLDMGSFIDLDGERVKTIVSEALNFNQGALTQKEPLDFSFLSESLQKEAETGMQKLDVLSNALVEAEKAKDKFSKEGNAEGVKQMEEQITLLTDAYNEQSDALDKLAEKSNTIADLSKTFDLLGGEVGKVGNAFTMLGEALGSEGLQAFGIIAQTIANIMLSFSQALIQAAYLGPWAWIAFGIQGIAQVASLVSQIKNLSAGEYAEGGVIPGNSFSGDKLWAKVNSGERILTAKQNENLERIANGVGYYKETGLQTVSYVKLRGSDIILSIQNQEKLDHKKYLK